MSPRGCSVKGDASTLSPTDVSGARTAAGLTSGVLRTRLRSPRLPPGCLRRSDLIDRILSGLNGGAVAVVAGAGYGKSTLLAQALADDLRPWVWVSCDSRLGDPQLLLSHVAAGLAEHFPGFGADLPDEASTEDLVRALCNEIEETVLDEFVLALDDVQALPAHASAALELLFEDLPPTGLLAIAGRAPLLHFAGSVRSRRTTQIGEADLALSEEEAGSLISAVGANMTPESLHTIHQRTEGWVAGLILAAQCSDRAPGGIGPGTGHFDYLAEEVLDRQPKEIQRFLLMTSLLGRFTPELAGAVSGRADAGVVIRELVRDHLFTVRLEGAGEVYRYHHLFQAFLRGQLAEREPEQTTRLHRLAAEWWLAASEPKEAVPHLLEAGDHAAAARALEPVAEGMIGTPETETLAGWLDAIPEALWAEKPSLILAHASLLLTRAEHEASFAAFLQAIDRLLERGDHERAAEALFRLMQALVGAGTAPKRRLELVVPRLQRIDPGSQIHAACRIHLAATYCYAGRFEESARELAEARQLPAVQDSPLLSVFAEIIDSSHIQYQPLRTDASLAALERATVELEQVRDENLLLYLPYARLYRAYLLNDLGRFAEALAEVDGTRKQFSVRGIGRLPSRALEWMREIALAGLERWDELERALPPLSRAGGPGTSYAHRRLVPRAALAAARGDAAAVTRHVDAARAEFRSSFGIVSDTPMVLSDLSDSARRVGLEILAGELADEARSLAIEMRAPGLQARAAIAGALALGLGSQGDALIAEALTLSDRLELVSLWSHRTRGDAPVVLARALAVGLGPPGAAARLLTACGGDVVSACAEHLTEGPAEARVELADAAALSVGVSAECLDRLLRDDDPSVRTAARRARRRLDTRPRPAITFVTLGGLEVGRDGRRVPDAAFGRQKARALVAALLVARGPIHREALVERLWADLTPGRGLAALRTTLHALRRALEPELEPGAESSLVVSEGENLRLALGERDVWDAGELLRLGRIAPGGRADDAAIAELEATAELYRGPLLPEWSYDDWIASARLEVEESYAIVLERLAEAFFSTGRADRSIRPYRRLLSLEPERESVHRALMRAYVTAGEQASALRQFHACRAVLRRRLGVEPGEETRGLYQQILEG